jgi:RimJ/RimL family protein N-acetyltransferase
LQLKGLHLIRGERLYLRAVERDDLERCHDWMNDESLRATLAQRYPMSLAQEADWIERTSRGQDVSKLTFAICLFEGDRHIGNCGLEAIERENGVATFGILIGEKDCHGKGFGEEATRVLCRFAFEEMNLHKIRLDVYASNEAAVRTYENVGFRREGVLRDEAFRAGRYIDVLRMGLLREEMAAPARAAATRPQRQTPGSRKRRAQPGGNAAPTNPKRRDAGAPRGRRGGARPRPEKR